MGDLGGGTGFILNLLIERGFTEDILFVDLDMSRKQLNSLANTEIVPVEGSITAFRRTDLTDNVNRRILFISRSSLHYMGLHGLRQALTHIRGEMRYGEIFVHQTACFDSPEDAGGRRDERGRIDRGVGEREGIHGDRLPGRDIGECPGDPRH